ncbi:response regulator [Streptomyces diacarni]|uniref:Transcriptional regulatory protein n=1 Tax=Streptomyces diacarni TaxID=2800381 RepID=A0A367EZL9_9ACTN|nr:response regulator [Streptomyces diacarni]RCG23564.1 response regulator [Streptomyces diacarni]
MTGAADESPDAASRTRRADEVIDVLVVDDDPNVARINAAYVEKVPGFHVSGTAHSAAEALLFLRGHPVDLVLLDHYLPDESGLALLHRLHGTGVEPEVIMVTAARDTATVRAAQRQGALQYVVKPFTFAHLRGKLDSYAALRHELATAPVAEATQETVDRIFGAAAVPGDGAETLPKGHSVLTADLVRGVVHAARGPLSAQEVAERAGLSRQTAQRYLKLLEGAGLVRRRLKHGETGRPVHLYHWSGPAA